MNKVQILNNVISGLMEVPFPKDGKTVGIGPFKKEMKEAMNLARQVQFAENLKDMREAYSEFRKFINSIQ